jgi:hypothetical protein
MEGAEVGSSNGLENRGDVCASMVRCHHPPPSKQNGENTMDAVEEDIEIRIEKPSRAERWKRSVTARMRRQLSKLAKLAHLRKNDEEAMERLRAKRLLEKQKKQKRKKTVDIT